MDDRNFTIVKELSPCGCKGRHQSSCFSRQSTRDHDYLVQFDCLPCRKPSITWHVQRLYIWSTRLAMRQEKLLLTFLQVNLMLLRPHRSYSGAKNVVFNTACKSPLKQKPGGQWTIHTEIRNIIFPSDTWQVVEETKGHPPSNSTHEL